MTRLLRWRIALLISAAIAISHFDRQRLAVAIAAIQRGILASQVSVRCTRLRYQVGRCLGANSLCFFRGWQPVRRVVRELSRRGYSLYVLPKAALGLSAVVMPCILVITRVPVSPALMLLSIAFVGRQSWSTLVVILPADLFPHRVVGSVARMAGTGGAMGGAVFGMVAGYLLDHGFGEGPVFLAAGTFHVLAYLMLLISVRRIAPVRSKSLELVV
jgi:hypothetical protein